MTEPLAPLKVVFFPLPGPVGIVRAFTVGGALAQRGHLVVFIHPDDGLTKEQRDELVATADVIVVQGPTRRRWKDRAPLDETKAAIVWEHDDNLWAWGSDPASADPVSKEITKAVDELHEKGLTQVAHTEIDEEQLLGSEDWLRNADLVTTTTEALASVFREHGAREVAVCPNALVAGLAARRRPKGVTLERVAGLSSAKSFLAKNAAKRAAQSGGAEHPRGKRVAWTGSFAHRADLAPALAALRRVMAIDGDVEVRSLGVVDFKDAPEWEGFAATGYGRIVAHMNGRETFTVPLAALAPDGRIVDSPYYRALEAIAPDVAVIPLRPSPFNLAKSDITLLSWSIQGVACVCSRVGPYAQAERDGFPAVYVDHQDEEAWVNALRDLLYDRARASELGERARAWVLERRVFPAAAEAWERALRRAVEIKAHTTP